MSVRLALAGDADVLRAEEAEIAAFLARLVRWNKAAVVRLRSAEGEPALGVFASPPFGGVLAVRSMALTGAGAAESVDATVSAGQLLEAVAEAAEGGEFTLPRSVTGPAWAGLLPPRGGWRRAAELDADAVRRAAAAIVAEFRTRTEALLPEQRTRAGLDALAEELWTRRLPRTATGPAAGMAGPAGTGGPGSGAGTVTDVEVPLRVVHAAHALGFLRTPAPGGTGEVADGTVTVLTAGPWVRLRTAHGSVAVRSAASAAAGLTVTPR
jgi:hypothetical protein